MDRLLWYLFAGSRGGPTRIRIVASLLEAPQNANQLARRLALDYKTVEYNLRLLVKNVVLVADRPGGYGALYYPSKNFLASRAAFDTILPRVRRPGVPPGSARPNWGKPEVEPNER